MSDDDLASAYGANAAVDGRQSETAAAVSQGVRRLFRASGIASVIEFTLGNGRRADVAGVSVEGLLHIVEIKSSYQDFRVDQKWPEYVEFCDYFYFAAPPDLDPSIFPQNSGLIVADCYGAEIVRPAVLKKISPARRRAVLLRFARFAANQLHSIHDPKTP